jgi:hypothetical protein
MAGQKDCAWRDEFDRELARAKEARSKGNEGMARVCARRAAGVVVRAYFQRRGMVLPGKNVLNFLQALAGSSIESEPVREVSRHFLLRITPDHVLPEDVDLIADVMQFQATLFPDC